MLQDIDFIDLARSIFDFLELREGGNFTGEEKKPIKTNGVLNSIQMKVLLATPYGRDGQGGIDRLNDDIIDNLARKSEFKDLDVDRLVTRGKRGLVFAQFVFSYALARFLLLAIFGKVDVLHIHLSNSGSSYRKGVLGALAHLLGVPYVVHLHGVDFKHFWSNTNVFLKRLIDNLFSHSSKIIVMGRYWAEVVEERLPKTRSKIIILPNATSASTEAGIPDEGSKVRITFLGQLGVRKGTPQLIQALAMLSDRDDWTAVIAGDGQVAASQQAAAKLAISDRVRIPGWLNREERNELLQKTDILVLPSFAENQPMVILEAFAQGIAVVSTPVGAIPDIVQHERNGFLVPPGDTEALASAITRLLNDPEMRRRFGSISKSDHAEHYEISKYVSRLAAIWQSVTASERAQNN